MENQNQQQSIFGLNVDQVISAHLAEAAKWGRFLAIVGFIFCGLFVLLGLFMMGVSSRFESEFGGRGYSSGLGAGMLIVYIIVAVIYFFPCLFMLRFSNAMKAALTANDQTQLTESFKNLKVMFRYMGILTIVILAIYVLLLLVGGLGAAFMG